MEPPMNVRLLNCFSIIASQYLISFLSLNSATLYDTMKLFRTSPVKEHLSSVFNITNKGGI